MARGAGESAAKVVKDMQQRTLWPESGLADNRATRLRETNPSEVAGLLVGPPGFEPGTVRL